MRAHADYFDHDRIAEITLKDDEELAGSHSAPAPTAPRTA